MDLFIWILISWVLHCSYAVDIEDVLAGDELKRTRGRDTYWPTVDQEWSQTLEGYGMGERDTNRLSSKFIIELYQRLSLGLDLQQATGHAGSQGAAVVNGDTIRGFPAKINVQRLRRREVSLSFNLTTILNRGVVKLAELRVRPSRHIRREFKKYYRIAATLMTGTKTKRRRKFLINAYMDKVNDFYCLNMTSIVLRWQRHMNHNDSLEVTLLKPKRHGNRQKRSALESGFPDVSSEEKQTYVDNDDAILLVVSEEGKLFKSEFAAAFREAKLQKRVKRNGKKKQKKRSKWKQAKRLKKECGRYVFNIDFNTLGWGKWIIQPKVFNAYFCYGECSLPLSGLQKSTNHAMMQGLMMSKQSDTLGAPCCVPRKLRPLSMLYFEHNSIVVRHHEHMVVGECGCV